MHRAVGDTNEHEVIAGFLYLVPVNRLLKLGYIYAAADHVVVVALILKDSVVVIFQIFPVVVVKGVFTGESPHMPVFPGFDIFFLELCG